METVETYLVLGEEKKGSWRFNEPGDKQVIKSAYINKAFIGGSVPPAIKVTIEPVSAEDFKAATS